MTFADFKNIVTNVYPEIDLTPHGKFGGSTKIEVAVVFKPGGKVYRYAGSYVYVLNRLGIKAMYVHDLMDRYRHLEYLIRTNDEPNPFFDDIPTDNSEKIASLQEEIRDIEANYIIVR